MSAPAFLARLRRHTEDPWADYDPQAVIGDLEAVAGTQEDRRQGGPLNGHADTLNAIPVHLFALGVPDSLSAPGRLSPLAAPIEADLNASVLFRDTVRSVCVRAEPHHGCGTTWPRQPRAWQERYAAILERRTDVPAAALIAPRYGVAEAFDALQAEINHAFGDEFRAADSAFTWAEANYDSGFRTASRMFHSERAVMTGRAA